MEAGQLPELNHPFWKRAKGGVIYVSGKKHLPYPKGWRKQALQVTHHKSGGATDGAQNIVMMMRMDKKLTLIKLKTWA